MADFNWAARGMGLHLTILDMETIDSDGLLAN